MMKTANRLVAQGVILGCAILWAGNSYAQNGIKNVEVTIDGEVVSVPLEITQEGKVTAWSFFGELAVGGEDGAVLTGLNLVADPDPFLGYSIGVADLGAPSVFGFLFGTPIVPSSPPGTVTSGFSASLTDGGDGAISITPVAPGVPVDGDGVPEIHVVTDGFPLTNDGFDLGPAGAFGAGASVHGPFNEAGLLLGPGPWTWMQINVTFAASGGGDFYALTGSALKVASPPGPGVPETASTWLLTVVGLVFCLLFRRFGLCTTSR